jgi:hypothetical protein
MLASPIQASPYVKYETIGLPLTCIQIIKKVALAVFKDLALFLFLGFGVSLFVPVAIGSGYLVISLLVQTAVSLFFHSLGAFAAYRAAEKGKHESRYATLATTCEYMTGTNFALLTGLNTQFLVHETGHALAALSVYKNPKIRVEVYPFSGGLTTYFKRLNDFGKKLGAPTALALVIASGPGFTLLISSVILAVGLMVKGKNPLLGKYMICYSAVDFLNTASYALSTLKTDPFNWAHDFAHLSFFGLDPVVATIVILAVPLLISAGAHWWKRRPDFKPERVIVLV